MEIDPYQQANGFSDLFGDDDLALDLDTPMADTPLNDSFINDNVGDDGELAALMGEGDVGEGAGAGDFDLNKLNDRELEAGEKADNAQDYGDISDDELPDEEIPQGGAVQPPVEQLLPGITDSAMDDDIFGDDDLFGPSSPVEQQPQVQPLKQSNQPNGHTEQDADLASEHGDDLTEEVGNIEDDMDEDQLRQWRMQQELFAQSGKGYAPMTLDENLDEWLKLEYPSFKRDETPFWTRLLPPKPAKYNFKAPAKPPKTIRPSKVNLEIEPDQRTLFVSPAATAHVYEPREGLTRIETQKQSVDDDEASEDSDSDEILPGGLTMQDLDVICTDFDTLSNDAFDELDARVKIVQDDDAEMYLFGYDSFEDSDRPIKKRRLGLDAHDIVTIHQFDMPYFDDPERMTLKLASNIVLDLNDPALLVEEVDPEVTRSRTKMEEKLTGAQTVKDRLKNRFKTSNDAEYDLLKQNHQHKVRGQLGHMTIDHSIPAIRLQYPYYKVKLPLSELRNYHRKRMHFRQAIAFNKSAKVKRKDRKGKAVKEVYATTKDLSLSDNSTALLLEYSEEHPLMLSETGMGNKIVNYYRRRTQDDTSRPKLDIGDTNVLLPEDKSPFHIFGHIDPGETMTALYNSMYRAPIFEQPNKSQDFLVIRETTGMEGSKHYLRNIDHVYLAGQELPSVTIPGTHSRMVTTASKNRLKAISFRIARRKKSHRIRVEDVTRHFPDTSDMQNRQKMKEFMVFSKEHKEWEMKPGETVPDEEAIKQLIKPEDVCLLESMQVGHQYLQDAGFAGDADDEDDDGKDAENDSVEQQLAPWKTTKNFIQATQGKAMLKLYGEGDPSGRGEAFSFIKTSMKGGFKAVGGSVQDTLAMKKELGGHSYNVARQQKSYEESIRGIWDKQKASLSSTIEPEDIDDEGVDGQQSDDYGRKRDVRATPISGTPSVRRRDDETATSFSRRSINSQAQRYLQIERTHRRDGEEYTTTEVITDPAVIKQYMRIKEMQETNATS